jgi:hypothetical protein
MKRSAGTDVSVADRSSVCDQRRDSASGTRSTSTLPLSNSAICVLGSGMMRAVSESAFGAPPQYSLFAAKRR